MGAGFRSDTGPTLCLVRIAIVTESFLPQVNGVTNSVLRMCEHLRLRGHEALVIAPGGGAGTGAAQEPGGWAGMPVIRVPSVPLPGYTSHRVAWPWPAMTATLRAFRPDLVHLASPTLLGAQAVTVADRLGVPSVAVYQTDLAAYAGRYVTPAASRALWRWLRWVHAQADLTLAPSSAAVADLARHGIPRVELWPRGVDLERFHPSRRDPRLRRSLAPGGGVLVGYVGRLATEKQVELLAAVQDLPGVRLLVIGDGPSRPQLERLLPAAHFLGLRHGDELAALVASLDLFVHTGQHETFCQAAQEALAAGVPVVAPASGGLLDLVADGVNGVLYRPGDGEALRAATAGLVTDRARRRALGAGARPSVTARSWEAVGDAYLGYCTQLLETVGRPLSA